MEVKNKIFNKIESFIKRFYINELIKGLILFVGLGLLYLLFTTLIEYFLWLSSTGRSFLFFLFVFVEFYLLFRFIFFPIFKLYKLQKGINYEQASEIIGNHFIEISDKLKNFLQLSKLSQSDVEQNELLSASIIQKAETLSPFTFSNAINFNTNKKYVPYLIAPFLLLFLFIASGNINIISQGFDRVVHFNTKFIPPAPFQFVVLNENLIAQQNKDFVLKIKTVGKIIPENISVVIGDEEYFFENINSGEFEYTFTNVFSDIDFNLRSNSLQSKEYKLKTYKAPTINDFEMILSYPNYLNKKTDTINTTGNALVPEGTSIQWNISTKATTYLSFISNKTKSVYNSPNNRFNFSKTIKQNLVYTIATSNKSTPNFETLDYQINIIKDQYPSISTQKAPDSLSLKSFFLIGQLSDDYGLSKLQVVFYPKDKPLLVSVLNLPINNQTVDQFTYSFPDGLTLKEGIVYNYYFEVFDNDVIHNYKSSKSSVFSHNELTNLQKQESKLKDQNDNINSLEKSLNNQDKQLQELDKIQKLKKEKSNLDFKDQKKIEDFIQKQQQQDNMMKDFTKKLSENLENFNPKEQDKLKEELLRRLDDSQKQSKKNEKLLNELEDLQNKIKNEELFNKADELSKASKNQSKNLEQLIELTKRFYIEKKAAQIADKLNSLADKQDELAKENTDNLEKQQKIADEFDTIKDELNQLDKDNKDLKKPLDIPNDLQEQEQIDNELKAAEEHLKKEDNSKASKAQKSASKKMKEMSSKMKDSIIGGESEQMEEDVKVLRQILDNLLAFSNEEETLINTTKTARSFGITINKILKKQQDLKEQFQHVDDSIFAISMRNPMISEIVLNEIGNIHYNLEQTLESLSDNNTSRGSAAQQYVLSSANKLADLLSNIQSNMNMQMKGQGKPGKGSDQQLSDIIKKQDGLSEKVKEGMKPGEKPGQGKNGTKGKEFNDQGEGSEGNAGKVLNILKQQQQLRDALQKALDQQGVNGNNIINQMKDIEKQLINKGFNNAALQKMLNVKHELLKLENAIQQQGQDDKRKSNNTNEVFFNNSNRLPKELQEYIKSIEILNRQSLPLQKNYKTKVNQYFIKQ